MIHYLVTAYRRFVARRRAALHLGMVSRALWRLQNGSDVGETEHDYWSQRYRDLHIAYWATMCTYDDYVSNPMLWEAERAVAIRRCLGGRKPALMHWSERMDSFVPIPRRHQPN